MNPFDNMTNAFEQSLGNYKAGAGSIAQGKIQANEALTGGRQQLMRAGITADESIGTSEVQSKIAEGSQKLMKELGIDLSLKPTLAGIKGFSDFAGGRAARWTARFQRDNNPGLTTRNPTDISSEIGQSDVAFDVGTPAPNPLDEISDADAESLFRPVGAPATVTATPVEAQEALRLPPSADQGGARFTTQESENRIAGNAGDRPPGAPEEVIAQPIRPPGAPEEVIAQPIRPPGAPEEVIAQPLRGTAPEIGLPQGGEAVASNMARTAAPVSQGEQATQDFQNTIVGEDFDRRVGTLGEEGSDEVSAAARNETSLGTEATTEASGLADSAAAEVSTLTSTLVEGAGSVLSGIGGAIGDILPVVGPILAGVGLFEGFHKLNAPYGDAGPDPYATVRATLATGQTKLNNLGTQISSDQFATKVGQTAPAFGSLAAPAFSTAQQMSGATGHF